MNLSLPGWDPQVAVWPQEGLHSESPYCGPHWPFLSRKASLPFIQGFLDTLSFPHPWPQGLDCCPRRDLGVHRVPMNFCFSWESGEVE